MKRRTLLTVLGLLSLSRRARAERAAPAPRPRPPLEGTVVLVGPQPAPSNRVLRVRVTVRNNAHQSWNMPVVPLSIGQLSIEVTDANGRRIPTLPPPVPRPGDDRTEPLHQGQERSFELSLDLFSPELPPGTYALTWGARFGIGMYGPVRFVIAR